MHFLEFLLLNLNKYMFAINYELSYQPYQFMNTEIT